MLRLARHPRRALVVSLLALGLVVVACAGLLWAWIEYLPAPSGRPRYVPATPACAEALVLMREVYLLPKPPHRHFPPSSKAPLVYSLGPDGDDDQGRPLSTAEVRKPGADGDRVLGRLFRSRPGPK